MFPFTRSLPSGLLLLFCFYSLCLVGCASFKDEGPGQGREGALINGDIVTQVVTDDREHEVYPEEGGVDQEVEVKVEGGNGVSTRQKRFVEEPGRLWTNGIVPYIFLNTITADDRNSALAAMQYISDNTCIMFVPWEGSTTAAKYGLDHNSYIKLDTRPGEGCTSEIGNRKYASGQLVKCCERVTCVHELGHVLGWGHEQQSIERDGWVRINWQNITTDMRQWYRKRSGEKRTFFGYDISSTMHYLAQYGPNLPLAITVLFSELQIVRAPLYYFKEIAFAYQCQAKNCSSFTLTCQNEGFVTMVNGVCQCYCPDGLDPATGCTTILTQVPAPSAFPGGQYAMLAPPTGCPGGTQFQTGSLIHYFYSVSKYSPFLLKGNMGGTRAEQHFCVTNTSQNNVKWPVGDYCIYRSGGSCPAGFGTGWVLYDNKAPTATEYTQKTGTLPDGTYGDDVRFYFCCRDDGYPEAPVSLPNTQPLVLFKHKKGCHPIQGMSVIESFILVKHSSTETGTATSSDNRPNFFHYASGSVFVGYCYYQPTDSNCGGLIQLDANQRTATVTSPGYPSNYANNLDCHWIIKGPENSTIVLNIDTLDIEQKSPVVCIDELKVTHGRIGHKPITYCGTERKASIRSVTNKMGIQLLTTMSGQKKGFSATVTVRLAEEQCYDESDYGASYRGLVNFTRENEPCLPWSEVPHCDHYAYRSNDLADGLDGNYCRNPGTGLRPWCYTQAENCVRNYCDVCQIERPFDQFADCAVLQTEGLCINTYLARKGCTKTCQQSLPAVPAPVRYTTINCPQPQAPSDAVIVSGTRDNYAVGNTITFRCNTNSDEVVTTCQTDGTWSSVGYVCGGCPSGWYLYKEKCYRRFLELRTFPNAQASCLSYGAKLVTAKSQKDVEFLFDLGERDGDYIWLGLSEPKEGQWTWADGTALGTWSQWAAGHPKVDTSRNCARMDCSKEWRDVSCSDLYLYACSKAPRARVLCTDRRADCRAMLQEYPKLCQEQTDLAWLMCPSTCGVCKSVDCPEGWIPYQGSCYEFNNTLNMPYDVANAECVRRGTTLATAKDEGEYNFLRASLPSSIFWLGATDRETEGVWKWNDGTLVTYNQWTGAEPDNDQLGFAGANCMIMDIQGKWMDNLCNFTSRHFVCKTECPFGWNGFQGACYKFHDSVLTYAEAEAVCSSYGDDVIMTTAKDVQEFNFTMSILDREGRAYWLGLNDRENEGVFKWADGTPVIYNAWNTEKRSPEPDNMDGADVGANCAHVASNALWKDTTCDKVRRFICKAAKQCIVPRTPTYATASRQAGSFLSRGQYVTYACHDGYVPVSGDAVRTCVKHGHWTGSDLICGAESVTTTESSNVRLMDRQRTGDANYSYTGNATYLRIPRNGRVTAWRFYSNKEGQVAFQVLRPRPDLGTARFQMIGQTVVTTRANREQAVAVDPANSIQVQTGDVLGIYYGQTAGGVPLENCTESRAAEGLSVMRSKVANSNPTTLTSGSVLEFDNNPQCMLFSFRAVIAP